MLCVLGNKHEIDDLISCNNQSCNMRLVGTGLSPGFVLILMIATDDCNEANPDKN